MSCFFDNFDVVNIDVMLYTYPDIISNFLRIFNIDYCKYKNIIYSPNGINESLEQDIKCNCENYLFELNLLYYVYQANKCLLFEGKVQNNILSSSKKQILLEISSDGDLENVNIKQSQSTETELTLINVDDPSVQNSMELIYVKTLMGVITAFNERGVPKLVQFKDPDFEEKVFNLSGYSKVSYEKQTNNDDDNDDESNHKTLGMISFFKYDGSDDKLSSSSLEFMEKEFDNQVHEDLQVILNNMIVTSQIISLTLDNVEAERYDIDMNQETIQKFVLEKLSDNLLNKFFESIFRKTSKHNCKVVSSEKKEELEKRNNKFSSLEIAMIIFIIIILLLGIILSTLYFLGIIG